LSSGDHLKDLPAFLLSAKRRLSFWSNLPNEHYCTLESTSVSGANFMNGEQTSSAHVADSPSEDEKRSMYQSGVKGVRGDSSDKSSSSSSSISESFSVHPSLENLNFLSLIF
jgi:hypothetical protein